MLVYAATIFLSAFLLFQVQPLIAKFVLPWFGGSAAVWSAALLFFQLLLLLGYLYAHCLIRYFKPKQQIIIHGTLLAISLAVLPIIPADRWKPVGGHDPLVGILLLLGATIGLPYTLLSSTSPLLQAWYVRTHAGVIPYRLFALSNFGSMLALVSYPFLVEPSITLHNQAYIWSMGFAAFAIVCALAGWKSREGSDALQTAATEPAEAPKLPTILLWISLAACASVLLLATTSHLTQNVAPIPLLWVAPLSIYLLTFILSFESDRVYQRWLFLPLGIIALATYTFGMSEYENNSDVINRLIPMLCGALFICCMVCHGELAKRKPHPRYLTFYFLMVSVGGAIGGLFVALAAPHIFPNYWEMPIAIGACGVLMVFVLWSDGAGNARPFPMQLATSVAVLGAVGVLVARFAWIPKVIPYDWMVPIAIGSGAILVGLALWHDGAGVDRPLAVRLSLLVVALAFCVYLGRVERQADAGYILSARNFYGVLRVRDDPPDETGYGVRVLVHGTINHGTQLMTPDGGRTPTSYFGETSGINRAIRAKGSAGPIRIGILGLGAGVTATLARAQDTLHYYEINQLVFDIAKTKFNFWGACPADKNLYLGDGRLTLEGMAASENLDFLAMDAFTSDAVPMHLLTREAYAVYLRHLKPDGVLAINISNRYLDLEPIVAQAAREIGWTGVVVYDGGESQPFYVSNTWILLSKTPEVFNNATFQEADMRAIQARDGFRLWTDDYSNIIQILKR
jgi:spermidine synthase